MRKQGFFKILEQTRLNADIYSVLLSGDTSAISAPGQFVNILVDGFYLRRPISVCDVNGDRLRLVYRVVGGGTQALAELKPGHELDVLTGLGNGYTIPAGISAPIVVGGGLGTPPLYYLTKKLIESGLKPNVFLGFNTAADVLLEDEFKALGCQVAIATVDGSRGIKGFVTDAIVQSGITYDHYFTCGPEPMLNAVRALCKCEGQLSFEERMGCGFGACMGCSHKTRDGYKRICADGPVLLSTELG